MIKSYEITYQGKPRSINQIERASGKANFTARKKLEKLFTWLLIQAKVRPMKWMEVRVYVNNNFDIDNLAGTIKPFADAIKNRKLIPDDNQKFWDFLSIQYEPKQPKNTMKFKITGEHESTNKTNSSGRNRPDRKPISQR